MLSGGARAWWCRGPPTPKSQAALSLESTLIGFYRCLSLSPLLSLIILVFFVVVVVEFSDYFRFFVVCFHFIAFVIFLCI